MGKLRIIESLGGSKYRVDLILNESAKTQQMESLNLMLDALNDRIDSIDESIADTNQELAVALQAMTDAQTEYVDYINGPWFSDDEPPVRLSGYDPDIAISLLEKVYKKYAEAYAIDDKIKILERELALIKSERKGVKSQIEMINQPSNRETVDCFTAWYDDNLAIGSDYASAEIPGEPQEVVILPRSPNQSDKILTPRAWQRFDQAFFNAAVLPGWQKFKPKYITGSADGIGKHGIITSSHVYRFIGDDLITLDAEEIPVLKVDDLVSSAQSLSVKPDDHLYNVTIDYPEGIDAFTDASKCLVEYRSGSPVIIGQMPPAQSIVGGGVDWIGSDGRQITFLPGRGSRYGGAGFNPDNPEHFKVFENGRLIAIAPRPVMGAAIEAESGDLIIVCPSTIIDNLSYSGIDILRVKESNLNSSLDGVTDHELISSTPTPSAMSSSLSTSTAGFHTFHFNPSGDSFVSVIHSITSFFVAESYTVHGSSNGNVKIQSSGSYSKTQDYLDEPLVIQGPSSIRVGGNTYSSTNAAGSAIIALDYGFDGSILQWVATMTESTSSVDEVEYEERYVAQLGDASYGRTDDPYYRVSRIFRGGNSSITRTDVIANIGTFNTHTINASRDFTCGPIPVTDEMRPDRFHHVPSFEETPVSGGGNYIENKEIVSLSNSDMRTGYHQKITSTVTENQSYQSIVLEPEPYDNRSGFGMRWYRTPSGSQRWSARPYSYNFSDSFSYESEHNVSNLNVPHEQYSYSNSFSDKDLMTVIVGPSTAAINSDDVQPRPIILEYGDPISNQQSWSGSGFMSQLLADGFDQIFSNTNAGPIVSVFDWDTFENVIYWEGGKISIDFDEVIGFF